MNPFYFLSGLVNGFVGILIYLNRDFLEKIILQAHLENTSEIQLDPELTVLIATILFLFGGIRLIYVSIRYPHAKSYPMIFFLAGYALGGGSFYYLFKKLSPFIKEGAVMDPASLTTALIIFIIFTLIATICLLVSAFTVNREIKKAKNQSLN